MAYIKGDSEEAIAATAGEQPSPLLESTGASLPFWPPVHVLVRPLPAVLY